MNVMCYCLEDGLCFKDMDEDDVGDIDIVTLLKHLQMLIVYIKKIAEKLLNCKIAELLVNIVVVNGDARHSGHGKGLSVIWIVDR